MKITGAQIRAARAFLKWTIADLAEASDVGISTVQEVEKIDGEPRVASTLQSRDRPLLRDGAWGMPARLFLAGRARRRIRSAPWRRPALRSCRNLLTGSGCEEGTRVSACKARQGARLSAACTSLRLQQSEPASLGTARGGRCPLNLEIGNAVGVIPR